jgi:hypothetical protein
LQRANSELTDPSTGTVWARRLRRVRLVHRR